MVPTRADQLLADVVGDLNRAPDQLVSACAAALPVTGVALIAMTDSGPGAILAATDGPARRLEELQFTYGEGPCVDSSTLGHPVLEPNLSRGGMVRWPAFTRGALDAGVQAVFAFPLQVGGIRVGVLDLYRDIAGNLDDVALAEALAFTDAATSLLLHLQAATPASGPPWLNADVHSSVHQATGMIAVQAGVTLLEALVLLRARSFAADRSITAVANDVVSRLLSFA